ncbi:MAG: M48 family metallopeptidase [bacterium]|nr:M48 family metallopeptidase [bacterium]
MNDDSSTGRTDLSSHQVRVSPCPSELPLKLLVILASLAIFASLALSIFGAFYAVLIGAFLFFGHVLQITHIRGSGVRLGPNQFPELYQRVVDLAEAAGMSKPPTTYLMQQGGALNAFATKLFRGRIVVLYSDLLEACGDDHVARDMIIGHELGHHIAGHLEWIWLTIPGRFVPFLGAAYSRSCERTCDKWGAALCGGDADGAARGLAILAAGGRLGPQVVLDEFVAQQNDLDTGWMTLGRWLSNYPPLSERVEHLRPEALSTPAALTGPVRASGILIGCLIVPMAVAMLIGLLWVPKLQEFADSLEVDDVESSPMLNPDEVESAKAQVENDFDRLVDAVSAWRAAGLGFGDETDLCTVWSAKHPSEPCPEDPFDGAPYGLFIDEGHIVIYSSGADAEPGTDDDIEREIEP